MQLNIQRRVILHAWYSWTSS